MKYSSGGSSLDAAPATLLDSGTTLAYVPNDIFQAFAEIFSLEQDPDTGVWLGLCSIQSWNVQLEFTFGMAVTISVTASQILRAWDSSGTYCQFGFQPAGDSTLYILGDAFLTSAYVYYDFNAMQIGLAQAGWTA
jgi:yapsin 1